MPKKAKKATSSQAKQVLRPYRMHIDAIDHRIVDLIAERFAVVRRVAEVKHGYDIPAFIVDRVDEVRENAIRAGVKKGVDRDFLWSLYSLMIYHSCATEERIHKKMSAKGKKK
jgi:chorismate mutase-like protein